MNEPAGHCGKCGAPYFYDTQGGTWMCVLPPPIRPTCACWNTPTVVTTTQTFYYPPKEEPRG